MRRWVILPLVGLTFLAACETMQGVGQDIESGGEAISNQAAETQAQL